MYVHTFAISHKMKYAALWYEKKKFDEKGAVFFFTKISLAMMLVGTIVGTSPELRPYHIYGILRKARKS